MSEDAAEKSEKPTQKRRDKARKEGQVALSQEVALALSVLTLALAIGFLIPWTMAYHIEATSGLLSTIDIEELSIPKAVEACRTLVWRAGFIAGPVALLSALFGTLANLLQVGLFLNWENIGPKWSRLNPMNWLKKVFSLELPVNLIKSIFKGLGVVVIAALGVLDLPQKLWRLAGISPGGLAVEIQQTSLSVIYRVFAALVILAIFDVLWTRSRHEQKLMMSRQEVKDELKDSEGNPHVKSAMRKRMNEMSGRRLKDAMSEATVVTTNPTHYAVALRYWSGKDVSPKVVAKGVDYRAMRIRQYANELGVPVVEDKPLARSLYSLVQEGQNVPVELYRSVAKLLAIVYRRRGYMTRGSYYER